MSLLLLLLLALIPGAARAGVADLTLLDEVEAGQPSLHRSAPVADENGTAYWRASVDVELGGDVLMSSNGPLATDDPAPGETGDFPLHPFPTDALSGNVLLLGTHATAAHEQTNAIFQYPSLARIVYYGSEFPGFVSDPVALQINGRPLFSNDGSIYFGMRRLISFPNFTETICRASGGSIEILAQTGVSAVPGTGGATFTSLVNPVVSGGVVLFYGEGGGRRGVYQLEGGTITTVVDDQTVLPPNANPIAILDFSDVAYANDGHDVVIVFTDTVTGGVWKRIGGQWSRVVAGNTPIPDGVGNFFSFTAAAIRDEKVVFLGGRDNQFVPPRQAGIYTDAFGDVVPVVDLATGFGQADPRSFDVAFGGRWFTGTELVFAVDGSGWRELYRGTPVPEPGATATALAAAAGIALQARRRSHQLGR